MAQRLRGRYATDSGMTCLWDPAAFAGVVDYDTWEAELLEDDDIRRHITAGALVPINIQSDGVYEIEVRVGVSGDPAVLTDREARYEVVASDHYLFRSSGRLCVSGIEHVEKEPGESVGVVDIPEGAYAVTLHLIGWDEEPGMKGKDGKPQEGALPDFVSPGEPEAEERDEVPDERRDVPAVEITPPSACPTGASDRGADANTPHPKGSPRPVSP